MTRDIAATRPEPSLAVRDGRAEAVTRQLAEETPIAFTYARETHAVMMATPDALEDFAVGFSLTEGVIDHPDDITALDIITVDDGIELRMSLAPRCLDRARARRRQLAGPTGCGLCGLDSLAEAVRRPRDIAAAGTVSRRDIAAALDQMAPLQVLGRLTRATHAAALWRRHGPMLVREDVGRHNALDKLVGAAARAGVAARDAMLLLTSRVSIEMVQKACVLGCPVLVAISAPTAHAVRLAQQAGLTLIGVARADGFDVFTGATRLVEDDVGR